MSDEEFVHRYHKALELHLRGYTLAGAIRRFELPTNWRTRAKKLGLPGKLLELALGFEYPDFETKWQNLIDEFLSYETCYSRPSVHALFVKHFPDYPFSFEVASQYAKYLNLPMPSQLIKQRKESKKMIPLKELYERKPEVRAIAESVIENRLEKYILRYLFTREPKTLERYFPSGWTYISKEGKPYIRLTICQNTQPVTELVKSNIEQLFAKSKVSVPNIDVLWKSPNLYVDIELQSTMFILLATSDILDTYELDPTIASQILNTDDENDLADLLYDEIDDDTLIEHLRLRKVYQQIFSDLATSLTTS